MKTELNIKGMTCAHCQRHVSQALAALPGVQSAKASFKKGVATVKHDEAATIEAMRSAVAEAGYEVVG